MRGRGSRFLLEERRKCGQVDLLLDQRHHTQYLQVGHYIEVYTMCYVCDHVTLLYITTLQHYCTIWSCDITVHVCDTATIGHVTSRETRFLQRWRMYMSLWSCRISLFLPPRSISIGLYTVYERVCREKNPVTLFLFLLLPSPLLFPFFLHHTHPLSPLPPLPPSPPSLPSLPPPPTWFHHR